MLFNSLLNPIVNETKAITAIILILNTIVSNELKTIKFSTYVENDDNKIYATIENSICFLPVTLDFANK